MSNHFFATLLIVAGLLSGLEPLVISVFISIIIGAKSRKFTKGKQMTTVLIYLLSHIGVVFLLGLLFLGLLSYLPENILFFTALILATVSIVWGLIRTKNYFFKPSPTKVPRFVKRLLHQHSVKKTSFSSSVILAAETSLATIINSVVILSCLAAIIVLLRPGEFIWLFLFSLALMVPLLTFYWLVHRGLKISAIAKWRDDKKKTLELSLGLLAILLGWFTYLALNGVF